MRVGAALTDEVSRIMPGLDAEWATSAGSRLPWFEAGAGDLQALHAHWAARHPEAGPHFPGLRGWALWVWQPACFMVLSTHLAPRPFTPQQVGQQVSAGQVHRLQLHPPLVDAEPGAAQDAIEQAASLWRAALHAAGQAWQQVSGLGHKAGQAVVRDLVLAAVASLHGGQDGARLQAQAVARRWTDALGLPSREPFAAAAHGGGTTLVVKRAVCCLEWRCAGGSTCAGCPRRHNARGGIRAG